MGHILVSTECDQGLVFVSQLKTGRLKSLCEVMQCLGAEVNHKSKTMVFWGGGGISLFTDNQVAHHSLPLFLRKTFATIQKCQLLKRHLLHMPCVTK